MTNQLFKGTKILWEIPKEIEKQGFDQVKIYRSPNENYGYVEIDTLPSVNGILPSEYLDLKEGHGRHLFYLVTFYRTSDKKESSYVLTSFEPLPKELRIYKSIEEALPEIIRRVMTLNSYAIGLKLAIQLFNIIPPITDFKIDNFPKEYEFFLIQGGMITTLLIKYLPISIKDFDYSITGGVSLRVERGAKIKESIEELLKLYSQFVERSKMDLVFGMTGLGTIQLPLSLGGMIARGILNLFNVFQVSF